MAVTGGNGESIQVGPEENNARAGGSRENPYGNRNAVVKADAFGFYGTLYSRLELQAISSSMNASRLLDVFSKQSFHRRLSYSAVWFYKFNTVVR
jgi:hypothetical protein